MESTLSKKGAIRVCSVSGATVLYNRENGNWLATHSKDLGVHRNCLSGGSIPTGIIVRTAPSHAHALDIVRGALASGVKKKPDDTNGTGYLIHDKMPAIRKTPRIGHYRRPVDAGSDGSDSDGGSTERKNPAAPADEDDLDIRALWLAGKFGPNHRPKNVVPLPNGTCTTCGKPCLGPGEVMMPHETNAFLGQAWDTEQGHTCTEVCSGSCEVCGGCYDFLAPETE